MFRHTSALTGGGGGGGGGGDFVGLGGGGRCCYPEILGHDILHHSGGRAATCNTSRS